MCHCPQSIWCKKLILIHTFSGTWTYVPIQILMSPTIPYRKVFWMERVIQNVGKTFLSLLLHMKEKLLAMVIEEHHWWLRKEESWTKTEHGQRGTKDHPSYSLFHVQNLLNDIGLVFRYVVAGVFSRCVLSSIHDCCIDPVVYTRTSTGLKHWIRKHAPGVRDSNGCPKKIVIDCDCDSDSMCTAPNVCTNCKCLPQG